MTTNYRNAFILVATDCPAAMGSEPAKAGTIAAIQLALLREAPYAMTSDDLLFETHAIRAGLTSSERATARAAFFAKPQACLRCSPLVKQFGWGLHHNADERVAAYAMESGEYRELAARPDLQIVPGMRSRRA